MFKKIIKFYKEVKYRTKMQWSYNKCHEIASMICKVGFENDDEVQSLLDKAKDDIYAAAYYFNRMSEKGITLEDKNGKQ